MQEKTKFVIQNSTGRRFNIIEAESVAHPQFNDFHSPDVGILKIDTEGERFVPMPIASAEELRKVRIGTHLGTLGFPGELNREYFSSYDPETKKYKATMATFKDGWVGRITNYKHEVAHGEGKVIQHSASLTAGTSGSPMFNASGKVVAINKGGLEFYYDLTKKDGTEQPRLTSPAEIGYAIRADVLYEIWKPASK